MIFEIVDMPEKENIYISRFLAKTALEAFALKTNNNSDLLDELIDMVELNPLREYARYGKGSQWIYNQRRIYPEEARFSDPINHPEPYEILHELDFLIINNGIYYFTLVIMGIEYVINCGASELDLFKDWLQKNNDITPIKRNSEFKIIERA